jgi:hypothetical protein
MCVNGAITDALRKARRIQWDHNAGEEEQEFSEPALTPEELLQASEFWQLIRKKARDRKEYIVVYASYHLDLSPREILAEYPGEFKDVNEIYQHKTNFRERMERDEEIKELVRRR